MLITIDRNTLTELRQQRVMSMADLSSISGVSAGTICSLEHGKRKTRYVTLRKLAKALEVSPRAIELVRPVVDKFLVKPDGSVSRVVRKDELDVMVLKSRFARLEQKTDDLLAMTKDLLEASKRLAFNGDVAMKNITRLNYMHRDQLGVNGVRVVMEGDYGVKQMTIEPEKPEAKRE